MFSHRSFLVLGGDGAADIVSLMKGGFEVSNCHFSFQQGIDRTGRASTRVYGGKISLVLPQLPPQSILEWSLQPRKYNDGVIVLVDAENIPLEKVFFKNATCAHMEIDYTQQGSSYTSTSIVIHAEQLIVGNGTTFTNEWIV